MRGVFAKGFAVGIVIGAALPFLEFFFHIKICMG